MQSSFEVLEWDSISKEQDSLVHKLFGEISDFTVSKTSLVTSSSDGNVNVHKGSKLTSKGEKRKALHDEESTKKPKKKRKDKREKNKFKKDQKLNSQLTELSRDNQSATNGDKVDNVNQIDHLKKEKRESLHNNESSGKQEKKRKKKRQRNKFKTDESTELIETNEEACVDSINQVKQAESVASLTMLSQSVENFDKNKVNEEHIGSKIKKSKRKNAKERSKEVMGESELDLETNRKQKRKKTRNEVDLDSSQQTSDGSTKLSDSPPASQNKTSLYDKMTKQLESSRFRWINEQLYTTTGDEAVAMFSEDPSLFDIYHRGFTNQVKLWPVNPVDKIIEWLKKRPTSDMVADFGCGEAVIAQSVTNKVHSFDLVAKNKFVTACNMAKVPLNSESVDVAVFCLSLMGTNLVDFLREAHRVLKLGGILKVAEVTSRVTDTTEFAKSLSRLGFKLQKEDSSNKMFVLFDFIKDKESVKIVPSHKLDGLKLKPCIYKKR